MPVNVTPLHDRVLVRRLEEKETAKGGIIIPATSNRTPLDVRVGEPPTEELGNRKVLVARMDNAFSDYSHQAEKLSVLLAEPRDRFSWTSYSDLLTQRAAEVAAYEKYRNIKDELFTPINPPTVPDRPESSVN